MAIQQQLEQVMINFGNLDSKKKIGLIASLFLTLAATIGISMYFSMPTSAPLYSNLSREDVNNISRLLSENGIDFDASPETGVVEVAPHLTAKARVLLAEKGLPSSQASGYELFDNLNTLGLTSFMQDVTNKRAIEGELVRTIKMIEGVAEARVHLVMAEKNVYRRNLVGAPSASVVLKTFGSLQGKSIVAIRNLVSASVPGLESGNVTVVGANGVLLSSVDDAGIGGTSRLVDLEKSFESDIQEKISTAIGAYLGDENFRVSVSAKLNSDQRKTSERVFDPDSRVTRSVQVVREIGKSENKESVSPATIEQNLPDENAPAGGGQSSLENSERREEVTNYEINEKSISTVSDGYNIEKVTVALVVNKKRIDDLVADAGDNANAESFVSELDKIVTSAISVNVERGDSVAISVVDFLPSEFLEDAPSANGFATFLALHFNSIFNGIGLITAAFVFSFLGIRPLLVFLTSEPQKVEENGQLPDMSDSLLADGADSMDFDAFTMGAGGVAPADTAAMGDSGGMDLGNAGSDDDGLNSLAMREIQMKEHLDKMVAQSEERAAIAIKKWLKDEKANA